MILAVTGPIGAGKTSALIRAAEILSGRNYTVAGVLSARRFKGGERAGYDLVVLGGNGEPAPLAAMESPDHSQECIAYCQFYFFRKSLEQGNQAIMEGLDADVLFIDEVGLWELSGGGWGPGLRCLASRSGPTVLGLREGLAPELPGAFGFGVDHLVCVRAGGSHYTAEEIVTCITFSDKRRG